MRTKTVNTENRLSLHKFPTYPFRGKIVDSDSKHLKNTCYRALNEIRRSVIISCDGLHVRYAHRSIAEIEILYNK